MYRILRWTGYASTVIGALLIIMAIIGVFRYHHHYFNGHMKACYQMKAPSGKLAIIKSDSTAKKQLFVTVTDSGKQDTASIRKIKLMYANGAPMMCNGCRMYHPRIGLHIGLAICFLLLAITLLMISNSCRSKQCCEHKEDKVGHHEEKKE